MKNDKGGDFDFMKTYVCSVCGYLYEEEKGVPGSSIAPGTLWQDLPADWVCPLCGASKSAFRKKDAQTVPVRGADVDVPKPERELSAIEMSILCSNLARGLRKTVSRRGITAIFSSRRAVLQPCRKGARTGFCRTAKVD